MPIAGAPDLTPAAIADCLDQSIPTRLLIIGQGLDRPFRESLERIAEADPERIFVWNWDPPLPSLSAAWNHGLRFCWGLGAEKVLVVNNDVRLHRETVQALDGCFGIVGPEPPYFVSAVGVTAEDFARAYTEATPTQRPFYTAPDAEGWGQPLARGGPDFSCFLISKEGHDRYPFDERFIPAYCEDCSAHREYMLGGDGDRIFSINLPYLHYASGTLKSDAPEQRAQRERRIAGSRAYYAQKWGGPVNEETYARPFEPTSTMVGITTPELQAGVRITPYDQLVGNDRWPAGVCGGIYLDTDRKVAIACLQDPGHALPHRGPTATPLQTQTAEVADVPTVEPARPGDPVGAGVLGDPSDCGGVWPAGADRGGVGCDPGDPGGDRTVVTVGSVADVDPAAPVIPGLVDCRAAGHNVYQRKAPGPLGTTWQVGCVTCGYGIGTH